MGIGVGVKAGSNVAVGRSVVVAVGGDVGAGIIDDVAVEGCVAAGSTVPQAIKMSPARSGINSWSLIRIS